MARTNIVAQALIGAYPTAAQVSGDDMVLELTSTSDPTDRKTTLIDNKTVLLAYNSDASPHTVTITSIPDALNRVGDIVQTLEAGEIWVYGPCKSVGFNQTGNVLFIDVSDPTVQLSVITLP